MASPLDLLGASGKFMPNMDYTKPSPEFMDRPENRNFGAGTQPGLADILSRKVRVDNRGTGANKHGARAKITAQLTDDIDMMAKLSYNNYKKDMALKGLAAGVQTPVGRFGVDYRPEVGPYQGQGYTGINFSRKF